MITLATELNYRGIAGLITQGGFFSRPGRRIMKEHHHRLAAGWHRHMLPTHFRQPAAGGGKYGYRMRSAEYVERKGRPGARSRGLGGQRQRIKEGGRYALVLGGTTRSKAMARPSIRAFPTRAVLKLVALPSYITMKPGRKVIHPLGPEIVAIVPEEMRVLRKNLKKSVIRDMKQIRAKRTKRIK